MTFRKLIATLSALGLRVARESGGIAIYSATSRVWAPTLEEAYERGLDLVEVA